jgi:hypothetical protein
VKKAWYNPVTWFRKEGHHGIYVEVLLDGGFDRMETCASPEVPPSLPIIAQRTGILHIPDLTLEEAELWLRGRAFDWHRIHSHWRYFLELKGFHRALWPDVRQYLQDAWKGE